MNDSPQDLPDESSLRPCRKAAGERRELGYPKPLSQSSHVE